MSVCFAFVSAMPTSSGLLALLRSADAYLGAMGGLASFSREPCLHGVIVLGLIAQDDLVRDGGGGVVVAQEEHVQQVLVGHVLAAVQHELVGVDDASLAHHEHVHARHRLLAEQAHDVGVEVARGHRVLPVGEAVDRVDAGP